jgi:cold shock CspA family protein
MSAEQQTETIVPPIDTQTAINTSPNRRLGRVKWFNNKAGYGFLKVVEDNGVESEDVFVHHSVIKVAKEQFRYLVQGEYIDFTIGLLETGQHKFQATEVSGVNGCKLMCETRNEAYASRQNNPSSATENRRPYKQQAQQQHQQEQKEGTQRPTSSFLRQKQPEESGSSGGWTVKKSRETGMKKSTQKQL